MQFAGAVLQATHPHRQRRIKLSTYGDYQQRLHQLVARSELKALEASRSAQRMGRVAPVRHKCFISYHGADIAEVTAFVERFNEVFIPRVVGASDSDHFSDPVDSKTEEYIKQQIGAKYLSDSSVTLLYVGSCTWSRKFVDWEISSSLRNDPVNKRNGLLAITPPDNSTNRLPSRFSANYQRDHESYAGYIYYPTTDAALRTAINDAFAARTNAGRIALIDNTAALRRQNSAC